MMLEVLRDRPVKDGLSDIIIAPMSFSWTITAPVRENDFSKKGPVWYANKIRIFHLIQWFLDLADYECHTLAMPIQRESSTTTEEENPKLEGDIAESVSNALPDFNFSTVP
ncbi:hypothetical protein PQX77_022116 [Marasmius sp. AFHP31]|nr:hypothetical protein PQX77_022116 [Marasmius sp. AFHP31]